MNKALKYSLIGILFVCVLAAAGVGIAYAQDDPPHPHDLLADLLGLTPEEFRERMHSGETLEELADKAGIDLDVLQEKIQDAEEKYFLSRLEEALEDGEITRDHYDWLMEGYEKGYLAGGRGPLGVLGPGPFLQGEGIPPFDPDRMPGIPGRPGDRKGFDGFRTPGIGCARGRWND